MKSRKFTQTEIEEIFKILNIEHSNVKNYCPVWEVPPLRRGTKISINTKC